MLLPYSPQAGTSRNQQTPEQLRCRFDRIGLAKWRNPAKDMMRSALPFDRWHKAHPKPHRGDVPCKCGTRNHPLYPSSDHGRGLRWQARYVDHLGQERRVSFGEWNEAHAHLNEVSPHSNKERRGNRAYAACDVSFYSAQMIKRKKERNKRQNTVIAYEGHLRNHILPFVGSRPAASLRRCDSTAFVDHLLSTPSLRSPRSVVQVFKTWRLLMHYLQDEDVPLPSNIVSRVELPEIDRCIEVALRPEQVAAAAAAIRQVEPRLEIAVWLGACAGLRRGEVLGLKWNHIDWSRNFLYIKEQQQHGRTAPLKTKSSSATLPVDPFLIRQLTKHKEKFDPPGTDPGSHSRAVMNVHGRPVHGDHFYRKWLQALDRAGLPSGTRFHYLKRFYTSILGTSGLHDPKTVQVLSRHARFSETWDTYAQPPLAAEGLSVSVFSSAFSTVY
ncbi:tyrosine-type recombinase/integrase [Streptomyces sp. NPDC001858]